MYLWAHFKCFFNVNLPIVIQTICLDSKKSFKNDVLYFPHSKAHLKTLIFS